MNNKLILHHCAKRITPNSLEFVMDLFTKLDCKESYWEKGARWAMIEQGESMIIQFIETEQGPQDVDSKKNSHIAFLSESPKTDIENIKKWVESNGKRFKSGVWSNKEFYFDCPEVFIDFVVEIMHKSVAGK